MGSIGIIDVVIFVAFIASVVAVGLWKSREADGEKDVQDYFLAGRGLTWWLVGFSLIAANISTEQFVGMSGAAASHVGLAIASYEWLAAVTLTVVAFAFLPYFLRAGIYTMPEFLEYRFNSAARFVMALMTVLIYLLLLGAVTYSGALTVQTIGARFGTEIDLLLPSAFIALIAMIYVVAGGLKASVWADLLQGTALIIGGAIVMWIAFSALSEAESAATIVDGKVTVEQLDAEKGALGRFMDLNSRQLNMFLPMSDNVLPWTALLLGVWIPNFYYWGLNQYITQRTLGSSSLAEGQKGIVFAAYLKLLIPFVVVIPGILAFNLYSDEMRLEASGDAAKTMALYLKSNPDTEFVEQRNAMDDAQIESHVGPTYLIPLFETGDALDDLKAKNPFVLPMTSAEFAELEAAEFQTFSAAEDHAWEHVNPGLADEIASYNKRTIDAAGNAGKQIKSQALVAYRYDTALGLLLAKLPQNTGIFGFVMAALLGAVISSLAAMLNAASSIFTLDLCKKFLMPGMTQFTTVTLGRICVVAFALVALFLSPMLSDPNISNSVFTIIQKGQGLLSPGVLAVFAFGLLIRRAPRVCGIAGLLTNIVCYGGMWYLSDATQVFAGIDFMNNFLNWMAISLVVCLVVMSVITAIAPLKAPVTFDAKSDLNLESSSGAFIAGMICICLTAVLYALFSPLVIAK